MQNPRDVRRHTLVLFFLGIAVPSGLLGYLAFRGIRNDQALLEIERQEDLRQIVSVAVAAHDAGLVAVVRAFDLALSTFDSEDPGELTTSLAELARREPLIEAIFRLSPGGAIDDFAAPDLLYRPAAEIHESAGHLGPSPEVSRLEAARQLELRNGDLTGALAEYRRIVSEASDPRTQAEALNGVARAQRAGGDLQAATEGYRRLGSEFGHLRTGAGIPFAVTANLELIQTLRLAGDMQGAARTLLDLQVHLVRTERGLSRAQYGFVSGHVREIADELLRPDASGEETTAISDSLQALFREDVLARARSDRLLAFQESGGQELRARQARGPDSSVGRCRRVAVELGGHSFYALVGESSADSLDPTAGSWGILLDPDILQSRLADTLRSEAAPQRVRWLLRGPAGGIREASGAVEDAIPSVSSSLPGGVPALTIELFPPTAGFVASLLTSTRGFYFYAFLLLAGILAFGLTLTVRTLSHQLELARMQSDFVSTISHEFKSPLTAIRQLAEMLQAERVPSEERRRKYYDVLVEQSGRLSTLVDDVLDFARRDAGHHALDLQPIDLGPFLEDLVSMAQERVAHEGFVVRSEIEPSLPTVTLDANAIAQATTNLIDNGIKFSGDSREIVVRGFSDDEHAVIAIQDFGIGLSPADKQRVFERFFRAGDALTRSVKGTGLGLTLVKQITEAHGGLVEVESEPGRGSIFYIRLPLEAATT